MPFYDAFLSKLKPTPELQVVGMIEPSAVPDKTGGNRPAYDDALIPFEELPPDPGEQGTPSQQFQLLSNMLQANDAANPAPKSSPSMDIWPESIPEDEFIHADILDQEYIIPPDTEAGARMGDLTSLISDAPAAVYAGTEWDNDPQYYGLGVPPGYHDWTQPIESGHSQNVLLNPAAFAGWDAWSGRPMLARMPFHGNDYKGYSADVNRRLGSLPVQKNYIPFPYRTQQARDLLLSELNRRGLHNVVVADVPSETYTEQVAVIDPTLYTSEDIGPEGVLP